jgi:polyhydroxyalkanoate synthase
VCGRPARLDSIECPVHAIAFADDHIVPVASAAPLVELATTIDKHLHVDRGGHVGAVVSRKAADKLWPVFSDFWAARD